MKKQRPCRWAEVTSHVRVGRWVSTRNSRLSFSQCGFLTNVRNIKTKVGTRDSKSRCQRLVPILHPFPPDFTKEQEGNGQLSLRESLSSSQWLYFKITEYRWAHGRVLLAVSNRKCSTEHLERKWLLDSTESEQCLHRATSQQRHSSTGDVNHQIHWPSHSATSLCVNG